MAKKLKSEKIIAVIGLGYVGLPVLTAFSNQYKVIGFDINQSRIEQLEKQIDINNETNFSELNLDNILFTSNEKLLQEANFYIVAVPTPITKNKIPDFSYLISASEVVGRSLHPGDIVVYESTVYPGATEEVCLPILEKVSKLKVVKDFKIGYAPERINPGDKVHTFKKITKVVSGVDEESLETIFQVYSSVIEAEVFKASSIKVAEAAKVIENTQRDLNVALMNELSLIFSKLNIDTLDVIKTASTKWNFMPFYPGLVGGHCIGVDPYYLTFKAEEVGIQPQVILAGRKINDNMGKKIAENTVKKMIKENHKISGSKVIIFGITFKENCSDIRNSKVLDIVNELKEYGIQVQVYDPFANNEQTMQEFGIQLTPYSQLKKCNALIIAVAHKQFKELKIKNYFDFIGPSTVIMDLKGILNTKEMDELNIKYWRP